MPHIVIIGAGFVGLSTARRLRKLLPSATVTLIDQKDHFLFTPRLIDALEHPDYPRASLRADLRPIAKRDGFTFIQGHVDSINRDNKTIFYTTPSSNQREESITYDIIALCQGAQPCYYGIPGVAQNSFALKREEDVHHIHDEVKKRLDIATQNPSDEERRHLLSFVVVGAGPSGVEAVCALKTMVERLCDTSYTDLKPLLSWTLVQAGPQILPGFPTSLVTKTTELLERQGILVRTGATVSGMNQRELQTALGSLPIGLVIWTAGIEPCTVAITPEVHVERSGYLPVDQSLQIAPDVFGGGDIVLYRESNLVIPKNAQTALQMAHIVAKNLVRAVSNQPPLPYHYVSKGNILTVGKTGFLDLKFTVIHTSLVPWLRNIIYRFRFWQITGM